MSYGAPPPPPRPLGPSVPRVQEIRPVLARKGAVGCVRWSASVLLVCSFFFHHEAEADRALALANCGGGENGWVGGFRRAETRGGGDIDLWVVRFLRVNGGERAKGEGRVF